VNAIRCIVNVFACVWDKKTRPKDTIQFFELRGHYLGFSVCNRRFPVTRKVPVAEYSMPQFLQTDLARLWLRVLSHRHPRGPTLLAIAVRHRGRSLRIECPFTKSDTHLCKSDSSSRFDEEPIIFTTLLRQRRYTRYPVGAKTYRNNHFLEILELLNESIFLEKNALLEERN
jgi:hypothetical protein